MKFSLRLFLCGLFYIYFSTLVGANQELIIVRGSNNYPPFEYLNSDGEPEGFNVDIFKALMKELGYEYELKLEDWSHVVESIQNKNIDAVIGMIYSPDRAASVRFTLPTCIINRNYITRKSDNYNSFEELRDKELIVEKGGWFHRYLQGNNWTGKIIESEDIYHSLELLASGKHDAVLASELVANYAINKLDIKDLETGSLGIAPQNYSIAVNQNHDELLYQFNIGLQRLKLSGAYDQIYNKWFGIYESHNNRKILFISLAVFLFIAFFLILFVWLLRKQVARATRMLNYTKREVGIAIDAGNISAWTYIIHNRTINALHGNPIGANGGSIENIYALIHPEDVETVRNEFEIMSEGTKQSSDISFRIRDKQTEPYRYFETKMVYVDATKELPRRIVGTLKEVTNEVLMQQKLEDFLIKTEFIVKTNEIILIQYDIELRLFTRINDEDFQFEPCYTVDEYLKMVYPEDILIAKQFIDNLNRAEKPKIETEFRFKSNSGVFNWYIITAAAYKYNVQGNITSYIGLRRNNTKWKAINNDLILLKEKADASNRLKSAFLANMSHEIRTPLNAIVGFSELITDVEDTEEREKFIEIIKTNNQLLLQLINDILDLSRIESGHVTFSYAEFDFSTYFQELYASLKLKEKNGVELVCINRYEDLRIRSDQNRISQIITNFVTNAFKFTSRGCVTLDYIYENDGIKITVTDSGIGIAPENQSRVFERFEKINDFAQGTGLGLSICKEIAEALQGVIGVESELGVGSTFWFWLPCNTTIDNNITEFDVPIKGFTAYLDTLDTLNQYSPDASGKQSPKTILVAEDIDNNFVILNAILKENFNIIRAENGIEAIEKTQLYKPDIILMDMKMPMMNGLDATKMIRQFDSEVPIIALTAYVFDTNKQDALNAGCNDFLTKPVNKSVLMHILNGCIKV